MVPEKLASTFATIAAANVVREHPRHVAHLLNGPGEDFAPRKAHPAFYGSYDWHSAVHMHWLLARVLRFHPGKTEIAALLDRHLSRENLAAELRYFQSEAGRTFERPYGWAWLLELQAELLRLGNARWSDAVAPLAREIAGRFARFVALAPYPIRAGSHGNTAFSCILALDYADMVKNEFLKEEILRAARRWYASDRDAPLAYEPSLDDFLSPTLVEAALMQRVLPPAEFAAWLQGFVPAGVGGALAQPPTVADRNDPKQSHLDGLALSRAWCLKKLGHGEAAKRLLDASLPHALGGPYVGTHWLASFAALALGETP